MTLGVQNLYVGSFVQSVQPQCPHPLQVKGNENSKFVKLKVQNFIEAQEIAK